MQPVEVLLVPGAGLLGVSLSNRLRQDITAIVGRARGNPELMKPDPSLVDQALKRAGVLPARVAFIGDSITDVEVGTHIALRTIGYAKHPERGKQRYQAAAEALTNAIEHFSTAIVNARLPI